MNPQTKLYVSLFRIKELKAILERLSLPTGGRKAELQNRVFAYFGEPLPPGVHSSVQPARDPWKLQAAERIVVDTYTQWKGLPQQTFPAQQLQQPSAATPAAVGPSNPAMNHANQVEIISAGSHDRRSGGKSGSVNGRLMPSGTRIDGQSNQKIRCICEANVERGTMVQCEAEGCGVWQHCDCLGISSSEMPEHFFCDLCRASWADPFWCVASRLLLPTALTPTGGLGVRGPGGAMEVQKLADKTFQLHHSVMELVRRRDQYQLQAMCLMLNDAVPFRFQWPRNAELRVNGIAYRVYSRNPNSKVSNNTRDEPVDLSSAAFAGRNRIRLQANDSRKFVLLVQLMQKRTLEQVRSLMAPQETLAAALQRVLKQVGGGDEDLAIGTSVVSLRDPLSGARIKSPAHFVGAAGLVAFDLDNFLAMMPRTRKWQCPNSMRHGRVQDVRRDAFLSEVLRCLEGHPDVTEIEVSAEGKWRPAGGNHAWRDITDTSPLALPAPDTVQEQVAVKPEPGAEGSEEEELSEAEELRRAANAYATSSRRAPAEVIVLDDSSDDEPPRKRSNTMVQQLLQPSRHRLAGQGGNPPLPPPLPPEHASQPLGGSSSSELSHGINRAPRSYPTGAHGSAHPTQGISVRLPTRAGPSSQPAPPPPNMLASRSNGSQAEGSGFRPLVNGSHNVQGAQHFTSRQASSGHMQYNPSTSPTYRPPPTSPMYTPHSPGYHPPGFDPPAATSGNPGWWLPQGAAQGGHHTWSQVPRVTSPHAVTSGQARQAQAGPNTFQAPSNQPPQNSFQPRPPQPPQPPALRSDAHGQANGWAPGQGSWSVAEQAMMSALLSDDAASPPPRRMGASAPQARVSAPPPIPSQRPAPNSSAVIDLDSD